MNLPDILLIKNPDIDFSQITSMAQFSSSSTINQALVPSELIIGDPISYLYHPKSTLALGRGFNPQNIMKPLKSAITFKEVYLDKGAVNSNFTLKYVQNEDQLDLAISLDTKFEAAFLDTDASGKTSFKTKIHFNSNSIVVVATLNIDFGRWAMDASAQLTDEAKKYLSKPKEFAEIFGTRYVNIERRGASASVIIVLESVSNDLKIDFTNEFSGGGGWGDLSAEASLKFDLLFHMASKQSRLIVKTHSTGGNGSQEIENVLKALSDNQKPVEVISQELSKFMQQFNSNNAVPTEYLVAPMKQFGLDETYIDPWTDLNEKILLGCARDYRLAVAALEVLPAIKNGTHIISKMRIGPDGLLDSIKNSAPLIENFKFAIAQDHENLKQGHTSVRTVSPPQELYTLSGLIEASETPPTLTMDATLTLEELQVVLRSPRGHADSFNPELSNGFAILTPEELRAVLRSPRGQRKNLAGSFNPGLSKAVAITYGIQARFPLLTASQCVDYSTGETSESEEFRYDGKGAGIWVIEPPDEEIDTAEDKWVEWFAKHNGKFKLYISWKVRDAVGRVSKIQIMEVQFNARDGTLNELTMKFCY